MGLRLSRNVGKKLLFRATFSPRIAHISFTLRRKSKMLSLHLGLKRFCCFWLVLYRCIIKEMGKKWSFGVSNQSDFVIENIKYCLFCVLVLMNIPKFQFFWDARRVIWWVLCYAAAFYCNAWLWKWRRCDPLKCRVTPDGTVSEPRRI